MSFCKKKPIFEQFVLFIFILIAFIKNVTALKNHLVLNAHKRFTFCTVFYFRKIVSKLKTILLYYKMKNYSIITYTVHRKCPQEIVQSIKTMLQGYNTFCRIFILISDNH